MITTAHAPPLTSFGFGGIHPVTKTVEYAGALQKGNEALDFVVDLIPDSVPRSTARLGAGIVGVALAWFIVQKVIRMLCTIEFCPPHIGAAP